MNNVAGIDVSKGKSMVSVLRPFGEVVAKPFSIGHTGSELKELADYLKSLDGETRVVMEHTGRYYEPDRKSTRLNSSHSRKSRMPSSA